MHMMQIYLTALVMSVYYDLSVVEIVFQAHIEEVEWLVIKYCVPRYKQVADDCSKSLPVSVPGPNSHDGEFRGPGTGTP